MKSLTPMKRKAAVTEAVDIVEKKIAETKAVDIVEKKIAEITEAVKDVKI